MPKLTGNYWPDNFILEHGHIPMDPGFISYDPKTEDKSTVVCTVCKTVILIKPNVELGDYTNKHGESFSGIRVWCPDCKEFIYREESDNW